MKQEALVKHFENRNEEYINIVKTIKDKVHNTLSDKKALLQLVLLSLSESMRSDPDKYSPLIYYNNMSSTTDNCNQQYSLSMHRQPSPPYDYDIEDCKAILLDEAEKLYTGLEKRLVDEVIGEQASKTSASSPMLTLDDKQQQQNSSLS